MHTQTLDKWRHTHNYLLHSDRSEKKTLLVIVITCIMMAVEITAGSLFGSMALLADGWHMGTHAGAIGITYAAYRLAKKHLNNPAYTFGTGKVATLGAYTSALILGLASLFMIERSIERLLSPETISYNEAIIVAITGLVINIISAFILNDHEHDHEHEHHEYHDHNLKAAYLHVLADAFTSLLAIIALFFGKHFGWDWMDPAMGIVGAGVILHWAYNLVHTTGSILLDKSVDQHLREQIIRRIEADSDNRVVDLHAWSINANQLAVIISLVSHDPRAPYHYKKLLADMPQLCHITVEIHHAKGEPCPA